MPDAADSASARLNKPTAECKEQLLHEHTYKHQVRGTKRDHYAKLHESGYITSLHPAAKHIIYARCGGVGDAVDIVMAHMEQS